MLYTMEQLKSKLKRSASFIKLCLMRFSIKQTRLAVTKQLAYDISKEKMEEIKEYSNSRKQGRKSGKRNKKID